jgi:glucans biosynthesis protein
MPALPFRRCALAFVLGLACACGGESDAESTLPPGGLGANPEDGDMADSGAHRVASLPITAGHGLGPAEVGAFVEELARTMAGRPYHAPTSAVTDELAELDYDTYRSIRFRPEAAVWREAGLFQVQLFHPGYLYEQPVQVHVVEDSVTQLAFDPGMFRYDGTSAHLRTRVESIRDELSYAGFRVHFPLNDAGRMDEVAVFQGASYLRLVGAGQIFGLSARGLAVDVAADRPEEFPAFRAFWLLRPAPDDRTLVFHALLDSPSLTGAYRFALTPGERTELAVDARLFARSDIAKVGVAPLSSMFLFDADLAGAFEDARSGVHDSDGLLMRTRADEWIWRPLGNLRGLRVTSLRDTDPRGFGLAQRARSFDAYLDLEAQYHLRPSLWVHIDEDDAWGGGGVELLEIPATTEFEDNIAAYWVPKEPFESGQERRYRYTLTTFEDRHPAQSLGQVVRTRSGHAALPGGVTDRDAPARRFVIDLAGGPLTDLDPGSDIRVVAETFVGRISEARAEPLPDRGWRASFVVEAEGATPADMRMHLALDGRRVSETWSYVWYPEPTR